MIVIFAASTDMMSAEHTSRFIGPFLRWLVPDISLATIGAVQLLMRKGAHLTEYAVLGALLLRALGSGGARLAGKYLFGAWGVAVMWAALDEFHQAFVASRTGSPVDVMIDAAGALIGLTIYWLLTRRKVDNPAKAAEAD